MVQKKDILKLSLVMKLSIVITSLLPYLLTFLDLIFYCIIRPIGASIFTKRHSIQNNFCLWFFHAKNNHQCSFHVSFETVIKSVPCTFMLFNV